MADSFDVAIVGAGLSGLAAARTLKRLGIKDYVILEASDRVGGRTYVDEDGTDLGGAYFGPTQDRIAAIVDDLGLKFKKVRTMGKTIQHIRGTSAAYLGTVPPMSILASFDMNGLMIELDRLGTLVTSTDPHESPVAKELDSMTCEELLRKHCWTADAQAIARTAIRAILCGDPWQISALYAVWYIKQSGGCKRIFETKDGAQDSKVEGGAGQICPLLAKKYGGNGRLRLQHPVRLVDSSSPDHITLTGATFSVKARTVILALPPVQQLRMEFTPPLPPLRMHALQRFPMGHAMKTFLYYKTPFWIHAGLNGSFVGDHGIVTVAIEDSTCPPDEADPAEGAHSYALMGFIFGFEASFWATKTQDERKDAICRQYHDVFGSDEALRPIRYKEKNWAEEPWVGGCYVGACGPGVLTTCKRETSAPLADGRVQIAGTEAAWAMVGYMDGAVEVGERAARNVAVRLGRADEAQYDVMSTPAPSLQMPFVEMRPSFLETSLVPTVTTLVWATASVALSGLVFMLARKQQHVA